MRVSIRTALSTIVLLSVLISAGTAHLSWQRVAGNNSADLAGRLSAQIAARVRDELGKQITEAEAAFAAVRTILVQRVIDSREADRREFVFLAQILAQPSISWIAFGWPEGLFFAAHRLGDDALEMVEIDAGEGERRRRTDHYALFSDDIEFRAREFTTTTFDVREQDWFIKASADTGPEWHFVRQHPDAKRGAIAFSGAIHVFTRPVGNLAVMIELARLARFLGQLEDSGGGAAFILDAQGSIIAGPDRNADEVTTAQLSRHPLMPVALGIGRTLGGDSSGEAMWLRLDEGGVIYSADIVPLGFRDWSVAVIVPEEDYLGAVDKATAQLGFGLAGFVFFAALASVVVANRLIGKPLRALSSDLKHVETFDLGALRHRPSHLSELNALSEQLIRMGSGLSAFEKYLPRELVRTLVAEGIEPRPSGETRVLTVMFADVAGFTGMSERLGEKAVPLISRFLEIAAQSVDAGGGTVDKFIGDSIMAFWGAPRADDDQALRACRAALACLHAVRGAGLSDDAGTPLRIRIGLHSGPAVVGNIGSQMRLNYTALGDTVNIASRLEGINKHYGTSVIIGARTRIQAGDRIAVRELDTITLYGRTSATPIFELLDADEVPVFEHVRGAPAALPRAFSHVPATWVIEYEGGLRLFRERRWAEALVRFQSAIGLRGEDRPSQIMIARCHALIASPPGPEWSHVFCIDTK